LNGYVSGSWVNGDVELSLYTGAGNTPFGGTAAYEYSTDGGESWQDIASAVGSPRGETAGPAGALTGASYTASADIVQTVRFRTVSNSGVPSETTEDVTLKIDKTKPSDTQVFLEGGLTPDPDAWYDEDHIILTVAQDADWAPVYAEYSTDGGASFVRPELVAGAAAVPLSPGVNNIIVRTVDEAGNYSQAYGEAGRGYRVLRDDGIPDLTVAPSVNIRVF